MMGDMSDLLTGPLHDRHTALGATLGAFGGWSMPISYPDGTVAEHTAVRADVGVFDVSHLGKLAISGPGAAAFVNRCFTADLDKIGPGRAQYTLCCNERGGVLDDVIVYVDGPDDVLAVPNAANAATVAELLRAAAPSGITVTDRHRDLAVLAVQGPRSGELVPVDLDYMAFVDRDGTRVCRTGYTGEHGYELLVPWHAAGEVWDRLVAAGARPCGLGARDTLRTEMGYPLHGQDLTAEITPVQAGSGWAVGWGKPEFWGRDALVAEKAAGPARRLRGLRATGRGVPRPGMAVVRDGARVGVTTSGTFSPTLKTGIALALLDADVAADAEVTVDVRGRALPCVVTKPPFVVSHVR
jgi:aminomethyltransferase